MFRTVPIVIIRSFSLYTQQDQDGRPDPARKLSANLCDITKNFCVLHIQSNTTIFHLVVETGGKETTGET